MNVIIEHLARVSGGARDQGQIGGWEWRASKYLGRKQSLDGGVRCDDRRSHVELVHVVEHCHCERRGRRGLEVAETAGIVDQHVQASQEPDLSAPTQPSHSE